MINDLLRCVGGCICASGGFVRVLRSGIRRFGGCICSSGRCIGCFCRFRSAGRGNVRLFYGLICFCDQLGKQGKFVGSLARPVKITSHQSLNVSNTEAHSSHICAVVAHDQNGDSQNTAVGGDQGQINRGLGEMAVFGVRYSWLYSAI